MTAVIEAHDEEAMEKQWVLLCGVDDLDDGQMAAFEIGELKVSLFRIGDRFHATTNVCSHAYTLLTDGWFEDGLVECPLHGALFDVTNGEVRRGPADCPIETYETRIRDGDVEVALSL